MNGTMLAAGELEIETQLDLTDFIEQHVLVACPTCAANDGYGPDGDACSGLLYAWRGSSRLAAGDHVMCPPTPRAASAWITFVLTTNTIGVWWPGYVKDILRRLP